MVETLLPRIENFTSFSNDRNFGEEVDDSETAEIPPTPASLTYQNKRHSTCFHPTGTTLALTVSHELTVCILSEPRRDRGGISISYRLIHNLRRMRINRL